MASTSFIISTQLLLIFIFLIPSARPDFASDEAECADQLVGLATCLPYVEGNAKAPTPDCCSGLKSVVSKSTKCLCILVKDRDNPQLGFKLNSTLVLSMPATCNVQTNTSQCPGLLNLPANSPDAQIFKQFGSQAAGNGTAPSGAGKGSSPNSTGGGSGVASTHVSSAERSNYLWWGQVESVLVLPLIVLHLFIIMATAAP